MFTNSVEENSIPSQKNSEILSLYSGIIVVLSN